MVMQGLLGGGPRIQVSKGIQGVPELISRRQSVVGVGLPSGIVEPAKAAAINHRWGVSNRASTRPSTGDGHRKTAVAGDGTGLSSRRREVQAGPMDGTRLSTGDSRHDGCISGHNIPDSKVDVKQTQPTFQIWTNPQNKCAK
ncbi:hypothetical protein B0H10DRAFT_1937631 [Mycena sp. CBHHK59/15]|nr:hypothetical protein B0H10DRAFT_1937631 [Mycena sp. CBHHK59/15]